MGMPETAEQQRYFSHFEAMRQKGRSAQHHHLEEKEETMMH